MINNYVGAYSRYITQHNNWSTGTTIIGWTNFPSESVTADCVAVWRVKAKNDKS